MSNKLSMTLSLVIILAAVLAGVLLWNQLPQQMASHWNDADQVNGYMGKFWGIFMVPVMMAGLTLLFFAIPSIDPLRQNIRDFRGLFNIFIVLFNVFLAYVYALTLAWNMGHTGFHMSLMIVPPIGLLFILIGLGLRKAKRNYFIGIRTPWTLSSDEVWEKTHKLGGLLFAAAGVVTLLGIAFPKQSFFLLILSIVAASLISVIYSYLLYRHLENK